MNWDIDLNSVLSSVVIAAIISGIFKTIDVIVAARNRVLRKMVRNLKVENKNLNSQLNELQQIVSEQKATIEELQKSMESMTVHYNPNQEDSGYSDYISWDT